MIQVDELFGKDCTTFVEADPFNPKNTVEGYISRKSTEYYGALIITRINNTEVEPQLIMGTPKMHYPFAPRADGSRNYTFPSAKRIEIYEKLDGTNILAYRYLYKDYYFYTFKTRLRPFLSSSKFGDFQAMWREVGMPHLETIKKIMKATNCNLSFELYGARNPHLVLYKNTLDMALLFGVSNTGRIYPPTGLVSQLPEVKMLKSIDKDYVWNYEKLQQELEEGLREVEDEHYSGIEGTVWYLTLQDSRCVQMKCKPATIEAIHFASGGMGKNTIIATCWNAYENVEEPTVKFVKQLLLEEFKPEIIEANHHRISKYVGFVREQMKFRQTVLDEYRKIGKNILLEKGEIMRELSKKFNKGDMRKVYTAIINFA